MLRIRQVNEQQINAALNDIDKSIGSMHTEAEAVKKSVAEENKNTQKVIEGLSKRLDNKLSDLDSAIGNNIEYINNHFVPNTRTVNGKSLSNNIELNASDVGAATVNDITNAINGLDASSVGGDGKYIKNISETNGIISATEETMDTTPTANSKKAVTSGGVKTAIDTAETNAKNLANATGTLPVAHGGTGATTANDAANTLLAGLPDWTADPTDDVKLVRRDTAGSASFGQVKFSTVWNYIKSKISSILGLSTTGLSTGTITTTGDIHVGKGKAIVADGTKANYSMIKFKDNTGDEYGNGVVIGGGGATVIGGGESADTYYSGASLSAGSETMAVTNDGAITFVSNLQDGYASGKAMTMGTDGKLTNSYGFVGPLTGNASTATSATRIGSIGISNIRIGSAQAKISLNQLMTWLITTKAYIPSGTDCYKVLGVPWDYAGNDILQLSANGVNYELQLAGCLIEFMGNATNYNTGRFRLTIHSSPTNAFTVSTNYEKFPVSTAVTYTCNGSGYSPIWKIDMPIKKANGFWGLQTPKSDGTWIDSDWIRSTSQGIIPYQSGGAGSGHNSLGTSSWYWKNAYIDEIYGHLNGYANQADYTRGTALCTTAGGTAAKVASMRGFALPDPVATTLCFPITFTEKNTAASELTLNINGTGAKKIYINDAVSSSSNYVIPAGTYLCGFYNDVYYIEKTWCVHEARNCYSVGGFRAMGWLSYLSDTTYKIEPVIGSQQNSSTAAWAGWRHFYGGLKIAWGHYRTSDSNPVTLPVTYTSTETYSVAVTFVLDSSSKPNYEEFLKPYSTTQIKHTGGNYEQYWITIGY